MTNFYVNKITDRRSGLRKRGYFVFVTNKWNTLDAVQNTKLNEACVLLFGNEFNRIERKRTRYYAYGANPMWRENCSSYAFKNAESAKLALTVAFPDATIIED